MCFTLESPAPHRRYLKQDPPPKKNASNVITIHQSMTTRPSAGDCKTFSWASQLPKIVPHYTPQGPVSITAVASRKLHKVKALQLYCEWWLPSDPRLHGGLLVFTSLKVTKVNVSQDLCFQWHV